MSGLKAPKPGPAISGDGIVTARASNPPIQVARWARNGKHPNAVLESMKAEAVNQAAMFRTKEVFRAGGYYQNSGGTFARWRFAFHTGPYAMAVGVMTATLPQSGSSADGYASLSILDSTGATAASDTFHCGPDQQIGTIDGAVLAFKVLTLSPDTDYFATFSDNSSNLMTATVFELASLTQMFSGYLPQNFTAGGPILDAFRQNAATVVRNIWRRGAAQVLNYTVDVGNTARFVSSTTPTNVVDLSTGGNVTSSPGYTLDMTGKNRVSQTSGVPCVMKAYAKTAAAPDSGTVSLVNSAGTAVATITTTAWGTSGTWQSVAFNMPLGVDKYDLQFSTNSATFSLYAVSIYEYEA